MPGRHCTGGHLTQPGWPCPCITACSTRLGGAPAPPAWLWRGQHRDWSPGQAQGGACPGDCGSRASGMGRELTADADPRSRSPSDPEPEATAASPRKKKKKKRKPESRREGEGKEHPEGPAVPGSGPAPAVRGQGPGDLAGAPGGAGPGVEGCFVANPLPAGRRPGALLRPGWPPPRWGLPTHTVCLLAGPEPAPRRSWTRERGASVVWELLECAADKAYGRKGAARAWASVVLGVDPGAPRAQVSLGCKDGKSV